MSADHGPGSGAALGPQLVVARCLCGFFFAAVGSLKLTSASDPLTQGSLVWHLLDGAIGPYVALASVEVFLGALLLLNVSPRLVARVCALACVGFTAIHVYGFALYPDLPCGCSGGLLPLVGARGLALGIARNVLLIALLLIVSARRTHLERAGSKAH